MVFLVTARMPIDQDELELLRQIRGADIRKVLFAINKVDRTLDGDVQSAIEHNRAQLSKAGIAVEKIHQISALRAFQGNLPDSGLEGLVSEIREVRGISCE